MVTSDYSLYRQDLWIDPFVTKDSEKVNIIRDCDYFEEQTKALEQLAVHTSSKHLYVANIMFNRHSDDDTPPWSLVEQYLKDNQNITTLEFEGCQFDFDITDPLLFQEFFQSVAIQGIEFLSMVDSIHKDCHTDRRLDWVPSLLSVLQLTASRLTTLDLSLTTCAYRLKDLAESLSTLQGLHINGILKDRHSALGEEDDEAEDSACWNSFLGSVAHNTTLTCLDMSDNCQYSQDSGGIREMMLKNTTLRALGLGQVTTPVLRRQDGRVREGANQVSNFLNCLSTNRNLVQVLIKSEFFTDLNGDALLNVLRKNKTLQHLEIWATQWEDPHGLAITMWAAYEDNMRRQPLTLILRNRPSMRRGPVEHIFRANEGDFAGQVEETVDIWRSILLAFAVGLHPRLGEESLVFLLNHNILRMIAHEYWGEAHAKASKTGFHRMLRSYNHEVVLSRS